MNIEAKIVFGIIILISVEIDVSRSESNVSLNFTGLSKKYGYGSEQFEVITEDGYILTLFHISGNGTPVLFVHGLEDTSDSWLLRGKKALGIKMANLGRDCWFANSRGNRYSRNHKYLNPDDEQYWDFSFHEFGYYDLAAIIDTILKNSKASTVNVIGHSQGTTAMYVLLTSREEYNAKINLLLSLAPVCFLGNIPPPLSTVAQFTYELNGILADLKVNEIFGYYNNVTKVLRSFCAIPILGYSVCLIGYLFEIGGSDPAEIEPAFFRNHINYHFPAGTSRKNIAHFGQLVKSKLFQQYNYGEVENMKKYNMTKAPEYDLGKISAKVALFVANNDRFSRIPDVKRLETRLKKVINYTLLPRQEMNHYDFLWGANMEDYLYPTLFKVFQQYG